MRLYRDVYSVIYSWFVAFQAPRMEPWYHAGWLLGMVQFNTGVVVLALFDEMAGTSALAWAMRHWWLWVVAVLLQGAYMAVIARIVDAESAAAWVTQPPRRFRRGVAAWVLLSTLSVGCVLAVAIWRRQ